MQRFESPTFQVVTAALVGTSLRVITTQQSQEGDDRQGGLAVAGRHTSDRCLATDTRTRANQSSDSCAFCTSSSPMSKGGYVAEPAGPAIDESATRKLNRCSE